MFFKIIFSNFIPICLLCFIILIVGCQVEKLPEPKISLEDFSLTGATIISKSVTGNVVRFTVPYGTDLDSLNVIHAEQSSFTFVPQLTTPHNFIKPLDIVISKQNTSKMAIRIEVLTTQQPKAKLEYIDKTKVNAGDSIKISATNLYKYGPSTFAFLVSGGNKSVLNTRRINESTVSVYLPDTLKPGNHQIGLEVNQTVSLNTLPIEILFPKPVLLDISSRYLQAGDTISLVGNHIDMKSYQYSLLFRSGLTSFSIPITNKNGKLISVLPNSLKGVYELSIRNESENTFSSEIAKRLTVYEYGLPFCYSLLPSSTSLKPGNKLTFLMRNINVDSIRFYQVILEGPSSTHTINGIYDSNQKLLFAELPQKMLSATYQIKILLSNPSIKTVYSFYIDPSVKVE